MLTYVFLFIAASILIFQGTQLVGEIKNPLGTVPAEVALPEKQARRWGERLLGIGCLTMLLGFVVLVYPSFEQYLIPAIIVDGITLAIFALYLIFAAPRVQFMGEPGCGRGIAGASSADDDHHHHHT